MTWTNKVLPKLQLLTRELNILHFFQDKEWLDALNAERKKEQLNLVSYETFEIIMDRLEKEWFDLVRLSFIF